MNAKQLRNSILQMAIQGKLVPQDPNDEPASVLLDKIRQEKKRLVREGVLKKKDFEETPISEDDKPFEIPDSWEWCRIGIICLFLSRGKSPKYSEIPNQYPVFAQKCNLKDGGISLDQARFLDPETLGKWKEEYKLRTDDILVNSTGTGTVCRTRLFHEKYLGNYPFTLPDSHVSVVRTFENIDSSFYYYIFNSKYIQDYWEDRLAGSTNQKELYIGTLQDTIIPIPPLAEQHRIVAKLEEILPLVDEYGKAQEEADKLQAELPDKLRKSILQEGIQGKLVPQDPNDEPASILLNKIRQEKKRLVKEGKLKKKDLEETPISDDEKPFEIPDSWEWCRISDLTSVKGGKRIPLGKTFSPNVTSHIYIRVTDMKNHTIISDTLRYIDEDVFTKISLYTINKDDLYLTIAGTIGTVGEVPDTFDGMNLTENAVKLCNIGIYKKYLMWAIDSSFIQSQFTYKTNQMAQPKLAIKRIETTLFPLPPLSEQHRIVSKIEELFNELKNYE